MVWAKVPPTEMLLLICCTICALSFGVTTELEAPMVTTLPFGEEWILEFGYTVRNFRFYLAQNAKDWWTTSPTSPSPLLAARRASFQADMQQVLSSYMAILPVRVRFPSDQQPTPSLQQIPGMNALDPRSYIDVQIEYPNDSPFDSFALDITGSSAWMLGAGGDATFPVKWGLGLTVCDPLDPDYAYTMPFPGNRLCGRVLEVFSSFQQSSVPAVQVPLPGGGFGQLTVAYIDSILFNSTAFYSPPPVNVPTTSYPGVLSIPTPPPMAIFGQQTLVHARVRRTPHGMVGALPSAGLQPSSDLLSLAGGKIMTDPVRVYMIYVGYNSTDPAPLWLNYLVDNVGGTSYWNTLKLFYDVDNATGTTHVSGQVTLAGATYINQIDIPWVNDTSITDEGVARTIALTAINQGLVTDDQEDGIYVVNFRNFSSGLTLQPWWTLGGACAWHASAADLKFVFMYDAGGGCTAEGLTPAGSVTPSGDYVVDAMASTLMHELAETVTDPFLNAWYSAASGNENMDLCNLDYGDPEVYSIPGLPTHSVTYNQLVAGWPYLLQLTYNPTPVNASYQVGCVYGV